MNFQAQPILDAAARTLQIAADFWKQFITGGPTETANNGVTEVPTIQNVIAGLQAAAPGASASAAAAAASEAQAANYASTAGIAAATTFTNSKIYASVAAGLAATAAGSGFFVSPSSNPSATFDVYSNSAGSAVLLGSLLSETAITTEATARAAADALIQSILSPIGVAVTPAVASDNTVFTDVEHNEVAAIDGVGKFRTSGALMGGDLGGGLRSLIDAAGNEIEHTDNAGFVHRAGITTGGDLGGDAEVLLDAAGNMLRVTGADGSIYLPGSPLSLQEQIALATGSNELYNFIALSSVCVSDTVLDINDATTGSDQTAAIQAVLNLANTFPIDILWNVRASVSQIKIGANTRIRGFAGCGIKQLPATNKPMIVNQNESSSVLTTPGIDIDTLIVHGNATQQTPSLIHDQTLGNGWTTNLRFNGLTNARFRNVSSIRQSTFAWLLGNWYDVEFRGCNIDAGGATPAINTDGFHINGPGTRLRFFNVQTRCGDDNIALNADDGDPSTPTPTEGPVSPYFVAGGISDVLVHGWTLGNATGPSSLGLRLLSKSARIDDITIRTVRGATSSYAGVIDDFYEDPSEISGTGTGNVGNVTLDDWDVTVSDGSVGSVNAGLQVACKVENLALTNWKRGSGGDRNLRSLTVHGDGNISALSVLGFKSYMPDGTNAGSFFQIASGSVGNFILSGANLYCATPVSGGNGALVETEGAIGKLLLSNIVDNNLEYLLYTGSGGSVGTEKIDNSNIIWANG